MCVHYQFSYAPKLARKYEMDIVLVKQLTGQRTAPVLTAVN